MRKHRGLKVLARLRRRAQDVNAPTGPAQPQGIVPDITAPGQQQRGPQGVQDQDLTTTPQVEQIDDTLQKEVVRGGDYLVVNEGTGEIVIEFEDEDQAGSWITEYRAAGGVLGLVVMSRPDWVKLYSADGQREPEDQLKVVKDSLQQALESLQSVQEKGKELLVPEQPESKQPVAAALVKRGSVVKPLDRRDRYMVVRAGEYGRSRNLRTGELVLNCRLNLVKRVAMAVSDIRKIIEGTMPDDTKFTKWLMHEGIQDEIVGEMSEEELGLLWDEHMADIGFEEEKGKTYEVDARKRQAYTVKELERKKTLAVGQADDLKIDTGTTRVWLSRVDDGLISVEKLIDGRWEIVEEYFDEGY